MPQAPVRLTREQNKGRFVRESDPRPEALIVNVGPISHFVQRTHGNYHIPERGNARYSTFLCTKRGDNIHFGDDMKFPFQITGGDIANDLVESIEIEGVSYGLFVAAGMKPTEAELQAAEQKRDAYYVHIIQVADNEWRRFGKPDVIPPYAHHAVRELKEKRDWKYQPQEKTECPSCGEQVKVGVAMCKECGAILDAEKYAKFHPDEEAEVAAAPKVPRSRRAAAAQAEER